MCRKLKRKHKLNKENITRMKKTVKQRMQLKAQRMRRYKKCGKFYLQNLIFKNDATIFYREIGKEKVTVNKTPAIKDIERFLDTMSEERDFNEKAEWIKNVQTNNANIQEQQWSDNSVEELQTALKTSHKCKSAGRNQVSSYWLNSLCKGHYILASLLSDTIKNQEDSPACLSEGITYLPPKTNDTVNPKKLQAHNLPKYNLQITNIKYHRENVCVHGD